MVMQHSDQVLSVCIVFGKGVAAWQRERCSSVRAERGHGTHRRESRLEVERRRTAPMAYMPIMLHVLCAVREGVDAINQRPRSANVGSCATWGGITARSHARLCSAAAAPLA